VYDVSGLVINFVQVFTHLVQTRSHFGLRRMHEMQTVVTDFYGVCLSVCLSRGSTVCGAFVQFLLVNI